MSDSVGSVSVDVVPDARGWSEKLRAQIRDQQVKVKADADTAEAEAKLDEPARTRTAKIRADTSQLAKGAGALDDFVGKLGLLPALALTAGSALVPLVATLGGVALALAAPLAIAGGGATLFAFLGGLAAKDTEKQLKNITSLQKKLGGLTKGTAEYAAVQKRLHDAQAALTPQQKAFAAAQDHLTGAFQKFLGGPAGKSLLGVMAQGMGLLSHLLPVVAPLIVDVGDAVGDLVGDLDHASQSGSFAHFVDQVGRLAGRDIRIGGHILGDLAQGVGGLLVTTDKGFSGGFLRGLERLTANFADWANSRAARHDMREFFGYVHDVGPQVASTIGAVAHALGQIVTALAPLGPVVLFGIEHAAKALGNIPIPVLTALAGATAGLVAFQKLGGFKAVGFLTKGVGAGGVGGLLTGGVQKVFVVNMPPGGPGGEGGLGGALKKDGKYVPGLAGGLSGSELGGMAGLFTTGVLAQTYLTHHELSTAQNLALSRSPGVYGHGGVPETPAQIRNGPHINYGKLAADANGYLTSTSNRFDVLRTHAAQASRQIDLIGPHTQQAAGVGIKAIDALQGRLNAVHDKKFTVIAQTQSAVASLERLQAMRIADKHFTVYQRNQLLEQAVGPGGGRGRPNPGGSGGGGGGGGGGTPVHIHLDDNGRDTLTGVIQRNYDANRDFERNHG